MVSSKAKTVAEFMTELPPERQVPVKKLRALCKKMLKGFREEMEYGMPCYRRGDGPAEFYFQSQKQYISLYVGRVEVRAQQELFAGLDCGKSCIRFRKLQPADFARIEKILAAVKAAKPLAAE